MTDIPFQIPGVPYDPGPRWDLSGPLGNPPVGSDFALRDTYDDREFYHGSGYVRAGETDELPMPADLFYAGQRQIAGEYLASLAMNRPPEVPVSPGYNKEVFQNAMGIIEDLRGKGIPLELMPHEMSPHYDFEADVVIDIALGRTKKVDAIVAQGDDYLLSKFVTDQDVMQELHASATEIARKAEQDGYQAQLLYAYVKNMIDSPDTPDHVRQELKAIRIAWASAYESNAASLLNTDTNIGVFNLPDDMTREQQIQCGRWALEHRYTFLGRRKAMAAYQNSGLETLDPERRDTLAREVNRRIEGQNLPPEPQQEEPEQPKRRRGLRRARNQRHSDIDIDIEEAAEAGELAAIADFEEDQERKSFKLQDYPW